MARSRSGSPSAGAGRRGELGRTVELALHLARREVTARGRFTLFGWAWPLLRQLAQLGVLVVIFSSVLDLGVDDYGAFLFAGLVAWTWFSGTLTSATGAIVDRRHLVLRPRCPAAALPLVPVGVALIDALVAVPALVVLVVAEAELRPSALFLPAIAAVQLALLCGLAWLAAAATVHLRDVRQLTLLAVTLLFYLTPVLYPVERVPEDYEWLLRLNPMATLIEAYRDVLLAGRLPDAAPFAIVAAASVAFALLSLALFRRLAPGFVDEL